jgi:hypothetical protein
MTFRRIAFTVVTLAVAILSLAAARQRPAR